MKRLKNAHGFTLVEMLIVVAIIGILAALALPSYRGLAARAKRAEAKTNLSGLYTAETAFFAEYNQYVTDLTAIGWQPEGSTKYLYGFNSTVASTVTNLTIKAKCFNTDTATYDSTCGSARFTNGGPLTTWVPDAALIMTPATASASATFLAGAEGSIGGSSNDVWTMNQNRQLLNKTNGAD